MNSHTNSHKLKAIVLLLALLSATAFLSYTSWLPAAASAPRAVTVASHWSEEPQILARQRGNPWINVEDGREVITTFAGTAELKAAMETNQSRPLALTTADFDEDGTPDIVAGYSQDQRGSGSFMRGNVDAVYGNSPEAKERKAKGEFTDTPFLGPARLFALPLTPDFLAAGDFDADGHYDLVTAARSENAIYFLKGDGRGGFALAKRIELAGGVTALLADDFNRRDGLNDLIIAVQTEQNSQLLIFEDAYGAMKAQPEIFTFAAPIKSLGIGSIEGDAHFDLAIAAGNELGILRGRDRKLLLDESGKQADAPKLTRRIFDFEIDSLAVGEFLKGKTFKAEIALLARDGKIHLLENGGTRNKAGNLSDVWSEKESISLPDNLSNDNASILLKARVSARSVDTLVVGLGERIHLLTSDALPPKTKNEAINYDAQKFELAASLDVAGAAVAILPMRLNVDALSDLVVMRVNSVAPAIIPTAAMASFVVNSNSNGVDCDGNDNQCAICPATPPLICTLEAAFDQLQSAQGASSITFQDVSGPIVRGVNYSFTFPLTIDGTNSPTGFVETTGTGFDLANDSHVVKGMVMNADNSGSSIRHIILENSGHSIVEGNRLGTNADGDGVGQGSANGVEILGNNTSHDNTIGGIAPSARNIISGNGTGILISAPGSNGTVIQGNYIGTDKDGADDLGNGGDGIVVDRTTVKIGGMDVGEGNLISGNGGNGIFITGTFGAIPPGSFMIQGNYIGTTEAGLSSIGNGQRGIVASISQDVTTIGGTTEAARNIISGNGTDGVSISTEGTGSMSPLQQVLGNYIGTNAAGTEPIANGGLGLYMSGSLWKVVSNNVISGNTGGGAHFDLIDATGNDTISNNFIGTDRTGTAGLGNDGIGLLLSSVYNSNISGNTIAANSNHGISSLGYEIIYEGNFIGTNLGLSPNLGNGGDGMRLNGEFRSQIGGVSAGNTIAFNAGNGINLVNENNTQENRIIGNSIFSNGNLGIDLNNDDVSANDDCDIDNGQNGRQNYPDISSVRVTPTGNGLRSRAVGTFNSTDGGAYVLDFYSNDVADPSGFGEGKEFLGSFPVSLPAGVCQVNFTADLPLLFGSQRCVSATATDSLGNTSEFSLCVFSDTVDWLGPDGAPWNAGENWSGGNVPTSVDNVTIPDNATVNINGGNFNAQTLSVGTNATLTIEAGSSLTIEDGTNNGTITGAGALNFVGTSLGNNGTISVAAVNAQVGTSGNKVLGGTGAFVGNLLTIASGVTLALQSNHQFNEIDTQGSFDTASRTVSLRGANPLQGAGNISSFGTIIFDGATAQSVSHSINFNNLTIANSAGVTFAGNAVYLVAGTLNLTNGILNITSSVPLTFENNANTVRTNGYMTGAARKNFNAPSLPAFTFPIGTANGYSPVTVQITSGTTQVTASVTQANQPALNPATSLRRYWTLTSSGGAFTADLTFNYLDPTDISGSESNYRITRVAGGVPQAFANNCGAVSPCVNTTTNTATITGLTQLSDWTLSELAPAACAFVLASTNASLSASGGTGSVNFTATVSDCPWTASSNAGFITITSAASGTGNGSVNYSVAANTSSNSRSGTLTIAGQTFTVNQAGVSCAFTLASTNASVPATAGTGGVSFTATASDCSWTAASNAGFITITSATSGTGNGSINYSVAANTSSNGRSGTLTIAGQTFTVNQAALGCTFTLASSNASVSAAGETGSVSFTAAASDCAWTANSNASWITVTSATSGTGNGTVGYSVAANTSSNSRTGTLTIGGQTFTVTQTGVACAFTLSSTSQSLSASAGTSSVGVTATAPDCSWTANSNAGFITVTSGASGTGNGTVSYSVAVNTGSTARSGTLTIGGQVFTVNQAAPAWEAVVLTASQVEIKTWTTGGTTYAYLKLSFPNAGYRVVNFGAATRVGTDFTGDAAVEKFTGASVQAVTTTAGIYDLGALSVGSYNFTFKTNGTLVKTLAFTVAAPPFPANSIDDARQFVKQQYRDFLNREADQAGEDFWTDNITKCNDPARRPAGQTVEQCTLRQRETTSGAFFLSPEFQYTGYYVYRMYQGGLGRQPKLSEFTPDAQFVGAGILVNSQLSGAKINQNKADYAQQFVNCTDAAKYRCSEFKAIYDGLNNQQYVDKLFETTGVNASASDRAALVNGLNANPATETRASVLQKVVDGIVVIAEGNQQFTTSYGQAFYNSESNRAFVQLQYFGYMKRDPDDAGYAFWLGKLNQFGGDFVAAEMVLAFISSPEYRAQFGQP